MKKMSSLLSIKDRQKYMKKLGLYTKGIDGKEGKGTKKGYEYINIIFLNVSNNKYTAKTDEKLRIAYDSYCKSEFMSAEDWKLFPNFKESFQMYRFWIHNTNKINRNLLNIFYI